MDTPNWDDLPPSGNSSADEPQQASGATPNWDDLQDSPPTEDDPHGTIGQQVLTGIEGAAKGFAGPVATAAELGLSKLGVPGLTAEDQIAREHSNPWVHGIAEAGGMGAGLMTGVGELGLLSKGAQALNLFGEASTAAKIGTMAIRGAIETGLWQGGDEISKGLLGQADPEAPVASALVNMGAAGALGGVLGAGFGLAGAGLKKVADTKLGAKASQFIEDFGNRWKFNQENPELHEAVSSELSNFYNTTKQAADEVYGSSGLKAQAIEQLVPEMNKSIATQNEKIANSLQSKMSEMVGDPDSYPVRLTKKYMQDANQWMEVATNPSASSNDVFNATQELKQKLQAYSKFEKQLAPFAPEKDFVNTAKQLQNELRLHLEDTKVWGDAGKIQQETNKAFTEFLPSLKDFERKFTTKLEGEPVIDPGKVKTYINQIGKPSAEIKQEMMENFLDAAKEYRSKIDSLHHSLGLESPIESASLDAINGTLKAAQSDGAKAADTMFHLGVPGFSNRVAHSTVGAAAGYHEGGIKGMVAGAAAGAIAPHIEAAIGRRVSRTVLPAVLKVLSSDNVKGIGHAIDYAGHVDSGAQKINRGINYLFGAESARNFLPTLTDKDREKVKKYVEDGTLNKELVEKNSKMPDPKPIGPQGFSEGGAVEAKKDTPKVTHQSGDPMGEYFPTQNIMLQAAKGRINNYLNSQRPQTPTGRLPFDREIKDKAKERSYDKVVDLANSPLSIIEHMKNGSLTPDHLNHFTQLYPELHGHLSKKIQERIVKSQIGKEPPPPYKTRQAMSLFLGQPLDSSMTPDSVQLAQSVYAKQRAPQQPQGQNKKGTSTLSKVPNNYKTSAQALETRQQKDH